MEPQRKYKIGDSVRIIREDMKGIHGSVVSDDDFHFMKLRENDFNYVVLVVDDPSMKGPYKEFFWESDLTEVDEKTSEAVEVLIDLNELGF